MTNRTVQIYGYGFGPTDATISVSLDGTTVFTGSIPTADTPVPDMPTPSSMPNGTVLLCSFDLPLEFEGKKPMVCEVSNGTVLFGKIVANHCRLQNPVFTDSDREILKNTNYTQQDRYNVFASHAQPPFSQAETDVLMDSTPWNSAEKAAILVAHGVLPVIDSGPDNYDSIYNVSDARSEVYIDEVPQPQSQGSETSWWVVPQGSILSYNLNVFKGYDI